MRKYLTNYLIEVEELLKKDHIYQKDLENVKTKIMFFQQKD